MCYQLQKLIIRLFLYFIFFFFSFQIPVFYAQNLNEECEALVNPEILDFEIDDLLDTSIKSKTGKGYLIQLDDSEVKNGEKSLLIYGELDYQSNQFADFSIHLPINIPKDSRIKYSAWVNIKDSIEGGENAGAMLRLLSDSYDRKGNPDIFKFSDELIKKTTGWQKVEITAKVSEDISGIRISALMQGKGKAWIDDLEIEVNGEKNSQLSIFKPKTKIAQIQQKLRPFFKDFQDKNGKIIVPKTLENQLDRSRVVGIGEATHGTQEIYETKIELIKYLIQHKEFKIVALESYLGNTLRLNSFIQSEGNNGEVVSEIANLEFWMYYTEVFKDFILWLKNYNLNTKNKVQIVGIDVQSSTQTLAILSEKYSETTKIKKLIENIENQSSAFTNNMDLLDSIDSEISKLSKTLIEDKLLLKNVKRNLYLNTFSGMAYHKKRDSLMAENVKSVLEQTDKIILWAHDQHLAKNSDAMGDYLNQVYDKDYANIGYLLDTGNFLVIKDKELSAKNTLQQSTCHDLSFYMKEANNIAWFLNKAATLDNYLLSNFYSLPLFKKSIGASGNQDQFVNMGLESQKLFDYYIFIRNSKLSTFLDGIEN
ncbi:erythromycin esterase family protein [Zunongwangia atlantica]|uniref:Erythromycin esterase n=1 Tax=Zunongwangia atlantica 22II14-10F7 TaxID=1185767 RepID=A0A1Y1T7Q0_9FLAO|nr:erythromycin esterase family protein [Zunongwangia atlantica]ORL47076.1 erythromycin esterase [Zunongwangia atlantica 22II14-10F7]